MILIFISYNLLAISQNLDSIPKTQRDSILLTKAKEVVLKYGPGYYREFKEPVIERVESIPPKGAVIPKGAITYRFLYEVIYLYDESKEQLEEDFAAKVIFPSATGEPASVLFGNGIGIRIPKDTDLRSGEEVEPIPYQPRPKMEMIIDEKVIPAE